MSQVSKQCDNFDIVNFMFKNLNTQMTAYLNCFFNNLRNSVTHYFFFIMATILDLYVVLTN